MTKTRCDVWLTPNIYFRILSFQSKEGLGNISNAVESILNKYLMGTDEQKVATDRLNKVIQDLTTENMELKLQMRRKKELKK